MNNTDPSGECSRENAESKILCWIEDTLTDILEPIVETAMDEAGIDVVPEDSRDPEDTLDHEAPDNSVVTKTLAFAGIAIRTGMERLTGGKKKIKIKKREKTKGANKRDRKQVTDAARQAGIEDRRGFGKYIEKFKHEEGRGGSDNFTFEELLDLAEEFKQFGGK